MHDRAPDRADVEPPADHARRVERATVVRDGDRGVTEPVTIPASGTSMS